MKPASVVWELKQDVWDPSSEQLPLNLTPEQMHIDTFTHSEHGLVFASPCGVPNTHGVMLYIRKLITRAALLGHLG